MSDPRANLDHQEEQDGASPSEQLIEACRRNNTDLLQGIIDQCGSAEKAAILLNESKTALGNYAYHEAALRGNYDVIDMLLDQEGFECDPISRREGDTPLHSAVRWLNEQPETEDTIEYGKAMINMMIEAGSDPRIKNRGAQTALSLCNARNASLRSILENAIYDMQRRADAEAEAEREAKEAKREARVNEKRAAAGDVDAQEENDVGSASDSDFDIEEFRRERERRKTAEKKGGDQGHGGVGIAF